MFICNLVDPFYPFKGAVAPFYPFKGAVDHSFPLDQTPTNLHSSHIVVGDLPYTRGGRGHVPPSTLSPGSKWVSQMNQSKIFTLRLATPL